MEKEMVADKGENEHDIVIVGPELAALLLHLLFTGPALLLLILTLFYNQITEDILKGFKDVVVYESSERLRVEGTAMRVSMNGWRALDQLGVGPQLRNKAILLHGEEDVWIDRGRRANVPINGEVRCLKRRDVIEALADALPPKTIRFGCKAIAVETDPQSMSPVLQLTDGRVVRAKVLIGCDGLYSKVANYLGLKPPSVLGVGCVRGLTNYPNGHCFLSVSIRMKRDQGVVNLIGRIPINDKLVYWFVGLKMSQLDEKYPNDPELVKQETLKHVTGFPPDAIEMIAKSNVDSVSFAHLRYRLQWEILMGKFYKGSVTVLGDAMHAIGSFLGQGGSAALEDAMVLARNMGQKVLCLGQSDEGGQQIMNPERIEAAFDQYVKERRNKILRLSLQTHLIGVILGSTSSVAKFIAVFILLTVFRDESAHSKYDCGKL
ncbi:OLC1v1015821C1 [Oldenlandia corymbosa var. corymbosa]|uniref:OLC1v1015821C1 n=1 Tax=Oldenlandia corymbosa var. corymbosa TaxID=529605 RepID=A0AAV1E6A5_OLDCO|nr:OLC1v1015821C1 [Oldenlandia corymbosa var. corymbosa]